MQLFLFTTAGCHLCDQALAILQQLTENYMFDLKFIDIANSDELIDQYGLRIPVVADDDNKKARREIGWPFTQVDLIEFFFTKPKTGNGKVV